jgi:hypothetical protein
VRLADDITLNLAPEDVGTTGLEQALTHSAHETSTGITIGDRSQCHQQSETSA